MILFLTSNPGGNYIEDGKRYPCKLDETNGFVEQLKENWKVNSRCLIISSDPTNYEINDSFKKIFETSFLLSGLSLAAIDICDNRNERELPDLIAKADVILLAGGHVPTQNAFFERIHLKERIHNFGGIVIGISAGSMNSAEVVYAQPELDGEAVDPNYQRFIKGLGLTKYMILPHYQYIKDLILDNKRVIEDITYPDSRNRKFYALVDGSFLKIKRAKVQLYGEAYLIQDGETRQICSLNEVIDLD